MNNQEKELFKTLLLQLRKELTGQMEQIVETGTETTGKEAAGDHSSYSFHIADMGSDTMEREKKFLAVQRSGMTVQEIDEALERIENELFGTCELCGCKIPKERLEFIPHTKYCINCQSKQEDDTHTPEWTEEEGEW
ncbi:TraR/DksA C4-type zinc finger protein [bacterium]|nr:TraR/DksA C4-type zinc finger protein [bacterium]